MKYLLNNRITLFLEHHFLSFSLSFYDMPSMSVHDFPFATIAAAHNIIREGKFPHRSDIFSMSVFSLRSFKKPQIRIWYEFFFCQVSLKQPTSSLSANDILIWYNAFSNSPNLYELYVFQLFFSTRQNGWIAQSKKEIFYLLRKMRFFY